MTTPEVGNNYKRRFTNRMYENKYFDAYDVLNAFSINDPMIAHAVKKLLVAGGRNGGKSLKQDIEESIKSLNECLVELEGGTRGRDR